MNRYLHISLDSLANWTEKFLAGTDEQVEQHSDGGAQLPDYIKFYQELIPFVQQLKLGNNPVISSLASEYEENFIKLTNALNPYRFSFLDLLNALGGGGNTASDPLTISAFTDIKNNCRNILYQIKINYTQQ